MLMRMNESEAPKSPRASAAPKRVRRTPAVVSPQKPRRKTPPQAFQYPGEDAIRVRAYQFYVERGGAPGDPHADWLRAESELIAEMGASRNE